MVFGPILLIHSVQHYLVKHQSIKLTEVPMHRSQFDFMYLSKCWLLARFNIAYHFTDVNIFFLSILHHTWCYPAQDVHHFTMHTHLLLSATCFVISACTALFTSKDNFSPLITFHRTSQITVYNIVSFVSLSLLLKFSLFVLGQWLKASAA